MNAKTPTKNQKAAQTLAQFITNEQSQLIIYKGEGQIPVNKKAQKSNAVTSDAVAVAVNTMSKSDHSTLMPKMPQMNVFWNQAAPLINGAYTGSIKPDQYTTKLDTFVKAVSKEN